MAGNFPSLARDINLQFEEIKPKQDKPPQIILRHLIILLVKTKFKKNLENSQRKTEKNLLFRENNSKL